MTPEQRARIEANRRKAIERLRERGILKDTQLEQIEQRNTKINVPQNASQRELPRESGSSADGAGTKKDTTGLAPLEPQVNEKLPKDHTSRPLERIKPSIRTRDYIEYDFATMTNLNGGYINPQDRPSGFDDNDDDSLGIKKQKTLEDWKREQQERRYLYENAPPPEHISQAPKCIECQVNIEMDPVMDDIFKLKVCKSCVKEHPEKYSLLTKTECKEDYFLTDPELNDSELFHKMEKPNPHSGTFARMQLFVRCEVERFAFKKWGGEEGLDKEWQRREEGKSQRREKKYQQEMLKMRMKTRAQEFTTKLKERKHGKAHIHSSSAPIDGGTNDDGYQVLRRRCIDCGLETEEISI
ncbi:hypothetical protein HG537_0F01070 [Torulaspora globosa]|uniref:DNA repair protein RAD14 n=1 Tax=Torulaspora globosa TaxID=48254 RepID=A0A7H9HWS2_9SACH|nr:hypothetical protein HG537_0F01070 [Torulaspora sp. CBS 2947]